jgi:hypothetical protein
MTDQVVSNSAAYQVHINSTFAACALYILHDYTKFFVTSTRYRVLTTASSSETFVVQRSLATLEPGGPSLSLNKVWHDSDERVISTQYLHLNLTTSIG